MSLIQPILIVLLLATATFGIRSLRTRIATRSIMGLVAATGTVFILHPELTNSVAHSLGVGRGADLMFYLFSLAVAYAFLIIYARYREVRRELTLLTRSFAIENAVSPEEDADQVPPPNNESTHNCDLRTHLRSPSYPKNVIARTASSLHSSTSPTRPKFR